MLEWSILLRFILGFSFTLLLILAAAFLLKKFYSLKGIGGQGPKKLKLLESLMIDPKHRLVRVSLEKEEFLIVLGGQQPYCLNPHKETADKK